MPAAKKKGSFVCTLKRNPEMMGPTTKAAVQARFNVPMSLARPHPVRRSATQA